MFKSPPKRPSKRLIRSLPDTYHDNNLVPMVPLKYQGIVGDPVEANYDHLNGSTKAKSFPRGQSNNRYRRRTTDDFLQFVDAILDYTNYEQMRQEDLRRRHSSSPSLGSTGSGNESLPRSSASGFNDLEEIYDDYDDYVDSSTSKETLPNQHLLSKSNQKRLSLITKEKSRSRKINIRAQGKELLKSDDEYDETVEDDFGTSARGKKTDEDLEQVTCFCGRPFAGRPMIECTKCLTWIHLKCAKLTKHKIPDTWFCHSCKTSKMIDGKSIPHSLQSNIMKTESSSTEKLTGSRKRKPSRRQKLDSFESEAHFSTKPKRVADSELGNSHVLMP